MSTKINFSIKNISRVPISKKMIFELADMLLIAINKNSINANIIFTDDAELRKLNAKFRDKDQFTDILTFPFDTSMNFPNHSNLIDSHNGDIYIAINRTLNQSKEKNISHSLELKHLILHGILHLFKYDHVGEDDELLNIEESILGNNIH
jgi:probable rRNA maturation factor